MIVAAGEMSTRPEGGHKPRADATPRRISSNSSLLIFVARNSRLPFAKRRPDGMRSSRAVETTATISHLAHTSVEDEPGRGF